MKDQERKNWELIRNKDAVIKDRYVKAGQVAATVMAIACVLGLVSLAIASDQFSDEELMISSDMKSYMQMIGIKTIDEGDVQ